MLAFLCLLPALLNICGIDFSSSSHALPQTPDTDALFYALAGALQHALLEWSAVTLAAAGALLALMHYRCRGDITVAVIGIALLCAGLVDAFHTLAATRIIAANTPNTDFIPFTWALSRSFNAALMITAAVISLWLLRHQLSVRRQRQALALIALFFIGTSALAIALAIALATASTELPQTTFAGALISRPYDVLPLGLFALAGTLFWLWYRREHNIWHFALLLSILPEIATQLHMALGSEALFDNHFNIAHALKILAYATIFIGLLLDLTQSRAAAVAPVTTETARTKTEDNAELLLVGNARRPLGLILPLAIFVFTALTSIAVGYIFYREADDLQRQSELELLNAHSKLVEPLLTNAFEQTYRDVIFLSRTPPVAGIASAIESQNSEDLLTWQRRLQVIFQALAEAKSGYQQIRYFTADGRELVSIDRRPSGISITPNSQLQHKQNRGYLQAASDLNRGEVYFSPIELSYENGELIRPLAPVVRAVTPIYSESSGELFGSLVINLDFRYVREQLRQALPAGVELILANRRGDYLIHPDSERTFALGAEVHRLQGDYPQLQAVAMERLPQLALPQLLDSSGREHSGFYQRIDLEQLGLERGLQLLLLFNDHSQQQALAALGSRSLLLGLSLSIIVFALSLLLVNRLLRPLSRMLEAVEYYDQSGDTDALPVTAADEAGQLARSFYNLIWRKQQRDRELSEARKYIDGINDAVPSLLAYIDADGIYRFANQSYYRWFNLSREQVLGHHVREVLRDKSWQPLAHYTAQALAGEKTEFELEARHHDGNLRILHGMFLPDRNAEGRVQGFFATVEDITDIRQSERQLRQALKELDERQFALDQHAIVAITDVRGTITYANDRFCEISGYSREELLGQNHRLIKSDYHNAEFFRDMYLTISRGQVWRGEICNRAKSGSIYWVETTIVPFMDERGKPRSYIAIRTDITDRKQTEEKLQEYAASLEFQQLELQDATERAEQSARAKGEFLANMSHEIRTPMNGVIGMLGLLSRGELTPQQRHYAKLAQSSAESLLTLINDILDFSKIEAGKLTLETLEFNLIQQLEEFIDSMAVRATDKGLELLLDIDRRLPHFVRGDPGRLRQILTNLVGNAIKFTAAGEVVIKVETIDAGRGPNLRFSVRDTGIGIAADKLDHLFEAFAQEDASTTRQFGGTGLGLAICRQLVDLMGGELEVTSEKGHGSCFTFSAELPPCEAKAGLTLPELDLRGVNILLVDDNSTNRTIVHDQLSLEGAQVTCAEDARDALRLLALRPSAEHYQIAIIDMQMPELDGASLGEILSLDKSLAQMRLIMMTSIIEPDSAQTLAQRGFCAYLTKPVKPSDLLTTLNLVHAGACPIGADQPLITSETLRRVSQRSGRILLVEDNPINQEVALANLEELGFAASAVANGREALDALASAPVSARFDLILMDCQMPIMDGYQAARLIRAGEGIPNPKIPIIAMTANAMKGDDQKCFDAGMDDYLSKPIDSAALQQKLDHWLGIAALHQLPGVNRDTGAEDGDAELQVWDKPALLKRVRHKPERMLKLVELFLDSTPALISQLGAAIDAGQLDSARDSAHAIKGSAANLGAEQLAELARQLEQAAGDGDLSLCQTLRQQLPDVFGALQKALASAN